jgi:protein TonB
MNNTGANRISAGYELKDELARFCLPAANRDSSRKLAWMNSICILFLLIGIFGAKPAAISIQTLPRVEEVVPTIVEPLPPPPQTTAEELRKNETEQEKSEAPQVVVVTPDSPDINFAVPTIGNLVAPNAMAQAPPLTPMRPPAALKSLPATLDTTGVGGERPQPPYPKIALEQGQQGSVTLLMSADAGGNITSVEVKDSSGSPVLDRSALEYVKRHWTVPAGASNQLFQATITYRLQAN